MIIKNNSNNKNINKALNLIYVSILIFFCASLPSCNYNDNISGLHYFLDMHKQISVKSQKEDYTTLNNIKNGDWQKGTENLPSWGGPNSSVRVPPQGTIPRNYNQYGYGATDSELAGRELKNELLKTKESYMRGQKQYNVYCSPCHGFTGLGDGRVTPRFPEVPSLMSPKIKGWKDGEIFHIVTMGRGRMYPFANQIMPEDRWAIINYVRLLQNKDKGN